jgi:hypothetical protein
MVYRMYVAAFEIYFHVGLSIIRHVRDLASGLQAVTQEENHIQRRDAVQSGRNSQIFQSMY